MRVLVGIDGSEPAGIALALVAGVDWPDGSTIRVVEAIESGVAQLGGPWPSLTMGDFGRLEADHRAAAEGHLMDARGRLEGTVRTIETGTPLRRAATAIVEEARAMAADLVVVGSRGHGAIEAMLLGSVSAEVVDHAPAPVLVARGDRIDRAILAWDGSSCAARAAGLIREWPIFQRSTIRVVTVAEIHTPWWTGFPEPGSAEMMPMYVESSKALRDQRDRLAGEMRVELEAIGLTALDERREGDPATEILAAARESEADLIVLGTHGRTGLTRLLLGSVARNVLQHAACSVLVVRDPPA